MFEMEADAAARTMRAGDAPRPAPPASDQTTPNSRPAAAPDGCPKAPEPLPVVPGYQILGELGRGGMGVVYKARQLGLSRVVALKMIRGGAFAEPEFLARFRSEAEAAARLQHPNIVQVFAVGTVDSPLGQAFSCPFFSQEYVDGGTLSSRLGGTPQPPREAAQLVETLARAVHYAHEHGIVHRDLKPANILLQRTEDRTQRTGAETAAHESLRCPLPTVLSPKIADFGLAKQLDAAGGSPTVSGAILGTPEYMAPEQAAGAAFVGPAADVYALGVILYEMLTGRRPFEGVSAMQTLELVRDQEPVPPGRFQPKVPRDLETICLKCLEKDPAKRYRTASDLAEDLRRFQQGESILARRAGLAERAWRWARRRPAVAALTAATVLTAAGGVCGVTAAWLHALAGWKAADTLRERAVRKQTEAEFRRQEAEDNLYFSRIAQARLEQRLNGHEAARRALDLCRPPDPGETDRRGWEWYYLRGLLDADLLTVAAPHLDFVFDLAFSADGRRLVTAGGSPFWGQLPDRVRIWGAWGEDAGRCLREFSHPRMIRAVWYGGDGRRVAWAGADGAVALADAESGQVLLRRTLPDGFRAAVFSADGRRYAAWDGQGRVGVWELESGAAVFQAKGSSRSLRGGAFSPDGRHLAVSSPTTLRLWDVATGRDVRVFPQSGDGHNRPAFSPDGRLVALGTGSGRVRIWETATGKLAQGLAGHAGGVLGVAFSPDGRFVATAGADHTVRLWSLATGDELLLFRGHDGRAGCLAFHPSGRYVASGVEQPAEVKIWDLTRHQEYVSVRPPARGGRRIEAIGFTADGDGILVARAANTLQASDAATGMDRDVQAVDFMGTWITPAAVAAFRADGRRLAAASHHNPRTVSVQDPATGEELYALDHAQPVLHIAFSQDGQRLAVSAVDFRASGEREIKVWDAESGEALLTIPGEPFLAGRAYGALALSPDGTLLAHGDFARGPADADQAERACRVLVRDAATGEIRRALDGLPWLVERLAFGPNGRHLAVSAGAGAVFVYDLHADRWLHRRPLTGPATEMILDLAFSPDGRRIAGVTRAQTVVWDVATGQMVLALRGARPRSGDNGFNPRVAWSPDGRRLAASNWDTTVSIWDAAERHTPAAKQALHQAAEDRAR